MYTTYVPKNTARVKTACTLLCKPYAIRVWTEPPTLDPTESSRMFSVLYETSKTCLAIVSHVDHINILRTHSDRRLIAMRFGISRDAPMRVFFLLQLLCSMQDFRLGNRNKDKSTGVLPDMLCTPYNQCAPFATEIFAHRHAKFDAKTVNLAAPQHNCDTQAMRTAADSRCTAATRKKVKALNRRSRQINEKSHKSGFRLQHTAHTRGKRSCIEAENR